MRRLPLGEPPFQMIEELKDEELIGKIGGRFKLSALIQKRLVALNEGTPSAIDYGRSTSTATRDRLNTTIQEILQDKIYLDAESRVRIPHDEGVGMVLDSEFTEGY
jgi:DNA-directed RNA polymerase subunit omega